MVDGEGGSRPVSRVLVGLFVRRQLHWRRQQRRRRRRRRRQYRWPGSGVPDACVGLQCQQNLHCAGGGKTRLLGTVYTPKGDLPLPNVKVFVPNAPLDDFPAALTCDRCDSGVSGSPVTSTLTAVDGTFVLDNLPSGATSPSWCRTAAGAWPTPSRR